MEDNLSPPPASSSGTVPGLGEENSACGGIGGKPPTCKSPRKTVKKCESATFHLDGAIYTIDGRTCDERVDTPFPQALILETMDTDGRTCDERVDTPFPQALILETMDTDGRTCDERVDTPFPQALILETKDTDGKTCDERVDTPFPQALILETRDTDGKL
ncbi:hypothetical protein WDU94_007896 [Cyamophila willieti]